MSQALAGLLRLRTPFMSDNLTAIEKPPVTPKPDAGTKHPSGDKRFKILEVHMKKHQFRQDALIEVLHKAQELFGYLEDDLLLFVAYQAQAAAEPGLWRGDVLPFLHAQAAGRAYLRRLHGHGVLRQGRGQDHRRRSRRNTRSSAGETTPDNKVSLLTARCIGACGIAPAVVYDGTVTPRATPESAARTHQPVDAKMILNDLIQIKEKELAGAEENRAPLLPGRRLHVVRLQGRQGAAGQGRGRRRACKTKSKCAASAA